MGGKTELYKKALQHWFTLRMKIKALVALITSHERGHKAAQTEREKEV